jgi:hypothetical protein
MAGSTAAQAPAIAAQVDAESFAAAPHEWIVAARLTEDGLAALLLHTPGLWPSIG